MEKKKQEGSPDVGTFLNELSKRVYHLPRKFMKRQCHSVQGGKVWRNMLREYKK